MNRFVVRHKPEWDELEALVRRARRSLRSLAPEELSRLDDLYRLTTVHLAQVRTRTRDAQLVRYLSDLVAAAHGVIYLPPRPGFWKPFGRFLSTGFPAAVVRTWRFQVASLILLALGIFIGFSTVVRDPMAAYALMPAGEFRMPGASAEQLESVLRSGRDQSGGEKFAFSNMLFAHNLRVGLLAMTTGVLLGLPTIVLMLYNGMILGAFTAIHLQGQVDQLAFWAWILPHGVTELSAVVLCGGIGLQLGWAVIAPGLRTRGASLREAGRQAMQIAGGAAVMLILAAIIESYLRQSHLPDPHRLVFAAVSAVFWIFYLAQGALRAGRAQQV